MHSPSNHGPLSSPCCRCCGRTGGHNQELDRWASALLELPVQGEKMPPKPVHKHGCKRRPRGTGGPEAGGGGATPASHRPPSLSSPKCISERPTSSRVSKLTSDNPMVGGRAPMVGGSAHALTARPQVGNGAPDHAPWPCSYNQSPRKSVQFVTVASQVGSHLAFT